MKAESAYTLQYEAFCCAARRNRLECKRIGMRRFGIYANGKGAATSAIRSHSVKRRSPLKRARDTAVYIEQALQLTAIPNTHLQEINFGDFEGKPWNSPEFLYIHKNPFLKFPAGESFAQVAHRAYSIIEDVKDKHTGAGNILFVCHGVMAAAIYTYFKPFSAEELLRLEIKNCQLLEFDL